MNNRPKTSPIWKIEKNILVDIVNRAISYSEVLKYFDLQNKGGNFKTLKARLAHDNIDTSHFNQKHTFNFLIKKPITEYLVENSSYNRTALKKDY